MEKKILKNAIEFYKMDYEKGIETALKLEQTKLTYQRYFISLVTAIGTISVAFLKSEFLKEESSLTIESLIGLLLVFSTILGYILIRNLVSIRRQAVFFNNAIIYLRNKLIAEFKLANEFPQMKEVPENHKHSADYITILLCSFMNLVMLVSGTILLFGLNGIASIPLALTMVGVVLFYVLVHIYTIEKILTIDL
ncbi:hypothetical protein [Algibacter luteus]|uniref:hypothetical protein n=1 Tax=Algibacter luteus TaxID=1178825 RepID=UPI002599AFF1|nr:hypothetical protein [Algibacter luteus]WJJ96530.1 hypothetical protein O5O44_15055 [Algibacter luteus]